MPPRKRAAAKTKAKSPTPPPIPVLDGLKIALCGSFSGHSQLQLKGVIEELGATALNAVSKDTTHLIASTVNFNKPTAKVKAAQALGIPIVNIDWLIDSKSDDKKGDEALYLLGVSKLVAPSSHPAANATKKRNAASTVDVGTISPSSSVPNAKRQKSEVVETKTVTTSQKAAKIVVPVDEFCTSPGAVVYVDANGLVYDASLNLTCSGMNNNKFYRLQVLRERNGNYRTWTRWGRVGERGQNASQSYGDLDGALAHFKTKFKAKSGLKWENRNDDPVLSKYAYIERNYDPDSADESDDADVKAAKEDFGDREKEERYEPPKCSLEPPVQNLIELIFNKQLFAATMSSLNYDANKLPLGKLSKITITRGFQALKDLSALFDDPTIALPTYGVDYSASVERLSNLYYSVIPHAFGRNRPPILQSFTQLKKEIELLESLSDMKDAELLMKADRGKGAEKVNIHPADKHYASLDMEEVTPLAKNSAEFTELANYLNETRGSTHSVSYEVEDIFRIRRRGEQDRFNQVEFGSGVSTDTRLLWHGSRVTNFGGILGQGLRIAPPEAPVSGYMFGKGIYLADMSSKSANYCCSYISNNTALLLLCEAKLGSPMQELTSASYSAGDDAKMKGLHATLGQGSTAPLAWKDAGAVHKELAGVKMPDVSTKPGNTNVPNAYLQYNEYIVYDTSQVRLRYLFRVKM